MMSKVTPGHGCKRMIIDAGITPYPYPKWVCRLIAV